MELISCFIGENGAKMILIIMELIIRKFRSSMRSYNDIQTLESLQLHIKNWVTKNSSLCKKWKYTLISYFAWDSLNIKLSLKLRYEPDCEFEDV